MKVAFRLFGANGWTGGLHYLINLLSAIHDFSDGTIEPILFSGQDVDDNVLKRLVPYLSSPPVKSDIWTSGSSASRRRIIGSTLLQNDYLSTRLFKEYGIDVVFQHDAWYGTKFGLPTLVWIADFQHRHLPKFFGHFRYYKRDIVYRALINSAVNILLSSNDARRDCEKFYPRSKGKLEILPFAVAIKPEVWNVAPDTVRRKYRLPEEFLFLPNQFWKHKNHLGVIEALELLHTGGEHIVVATTGNLHDHRNREYPELIRKSLKAYGLEKNFLILGSIPFADIYPLMRASIAVINPSLFEGWSTTVEEAKALGVPLLLSDLGVHREQSPPVCKYFNPREPADIAKVMVEARNEWSNRHRNECEEIAMKEYPLKRAAFAQGFAGIAKRTLNAGKHRDGGK
jgi:glycosyltransferase involved in cell wall biosynthesis